MSPYELGRDGPSAILVAVDGSPTSLRAAAFAVGHARRQGGRLVCLFVRRAAPPVGALSPLAGPHASLALREHEDDVERELREGLTLVPSHVEAVLEVRRGDPYHEITVVADQYRADLVVVGASQSLGHKIAGSLAARLIRAGRWPVTVVP
ncbi:MAG: universal stress protein [Kineosporiaceae bacterium]